MKKGLLLLDHSDNVAIALVELGADEVVENPFGGTLTTLTTIPRGHKVALTALCTGDEVRKYGSSIGVAREEIGVGAHVHTHNVRTGLSGTREYRYNPAPTRFDPINANPFEAAKVPELSFYRRKNGKVGIRNELWVVPTVGCVNGIARTIVEEFRELYGDELSESGVEGVYAFAHPYGCSQLGDDHENTKRILQNIVAHPNAAGVLVLGLGCENNQVGSFRQTMPGDVDGERVRFLEAQRVGDEIDGGVVVLRELLEIASSDRRERGSWSELVVGLECGGSDAFSGITANPLIGRVSDFVVAQGGSTVLTEVPEMFGAEQILMANAENETVFAKIVEMINTFKEYYLAHDQPVYENPSPGNKDGGITTLEDKSLGCTRKAGSSPVRDVVMMDGRVSSRGLNLLHAPGNDLVATTTLGSAGCHVVLFSTGRGTPLGGFVPVVKIATNSDLAARKPRWIDFDAGILTDPHADHQGVLRDILTAIAGVVNGARTRSERNNEREIAIFKSGITL